MTKDTIQGILILIGMTIVLLLATALARIAPAPVPPPDPGDDPSSPVMDYTGWYTVTPWRQEMMTCLPPAGAWYEFIPYPDGGLSGLVQMNYDRAETVYAGSVTMTCHVYLAEQDLPVGSWALVGTLQDAGGGVLKYVTLLDVAANTYLPSLHSYCDPALGPCEGGFMAYPTPEE